MESNTNMSSTVHPMDTSAPRESLFLSTPGVQPPSAHQIALSPASPPRVPNGQVSLPEPPLSGVFGASHQVPSLPSLTFKFGAQPKTASFSSFAASINAKFMATNGGTAPAAPPASSVPASSPSFFKELNATYPASSKLLNLPRGALPSSSAPSLGAAPPSFQLSHSVAQQTVAGGRVMMRVSDPEPSAVRPLGQFEADLNMVVQDPRLLTAGDGIGVRREPNGGLAVAFNKVKHNVDVATFPAYAASFICPLLELARIQILGKIMRVDLVHRRLHVQARLFLCCAEPVRVSSEAEMSHWTQLAGYLGRPTLSALVQTVLAPVASSLPAAVALSDMKLTRRQKRALANSQETGLRTSEEAVLQSQQNVINSKRVCTASAGPHHHDSDSDTPEVALKLRELLKARVLRQEHPTPAGMRLELRPYQRQGLAWLLARESGATSAEDGAAVLTEPPKVRGGILADDMGLGKTIQILALVLAARTRDAAPAAVPSPSESDSTSVSTAEGSTTPAPIASSATLIVCPLSLLSQWQSEIARHTEPGLVSVAVHHGPSRGRDPAALAKHDIVLTTYATLATELPSEKRHEKPEEVLLRVGWRRVVLDEAHVVKDRTTRTAHAARALHAGTRWAVTGTPVQNKLDDVFSLLWFLRADPCGDSLWWTTNIMRPIRNQDERGFLRLQELLAHVCLRRTKDQKSGEETIVNLPARAVGIRRDRLSPEEDALYQSLWISSSEEFNAFLASGSLLQNYAHVLQLLLRLRQACDHPSLVLAGSSETAARLAPARVVPLVQAYVSAIAQATAPANFEHLRSALAALNSQDCSACQESMEDPLVTMCGHFFCRSCLLGEATAAVDASLAANSDTAASVPATTVACPCCKTVLSNPRDLVALPPTVCTASSSACSAASDSNHSTKLLALMAELRKVDEEDPEAKVIVFSQWTSMLDLVAQQLDAADRSFVRLDGRMTQTARAQAMRKFNNDPEMRVFLISMKAGGLGLNLVAANHVFLLDPWWNPAAEEQAIDRVHRIGQTKPVRVTRFVIADSIEERILELQEKKRQLTQGALGARSGRDIRIDDLKLLFRPSQVPTAASLPGNCSGVANHSSAMLSTIQTPQPPLSLTNKLPTSF